MIDEETGSLLFLLKAAMPSDITKQIPQMKANRDKNKSQRMGLISCKIALFCQPNTYV